METGARLFIIDDEEDVLEVYTDYLSDDFLVEAFTNAKDALKKISSGEIPDAIVTDLKMPEMTGTEFIKEVRKIGFRNPVLILSGNTQIEDALNALEYGVVDIIEKPVRQEQLVNSIKLAVNSSIIKKINDELLHKFESLTSLMDKLSRQYEERFIKAEDLLVDLHVPIAKDLRAHFKQVRETKETETEITELRDEVKLLRLKAEFANNLFKSKS